VSEAAPTILALQPDSPWVVILVVSFVTFLLVLALRRLIGRPGGLASGLLLILPLALPLVAGLLFGHPGLPEIAVLRPAVAALRGPGRSLEHLMLLRDAGSRIVIPYALAGSTGPWLLVVAGFVSSVMLLRRAGGALVVARLVRRCSTLGEGGRHDVAGLAARLAGATGLNHVPEILVLPPGIPGAFTVGTKRARILLSRELLEGLSEEELEAALAHEIAHVEARDPRLVLAAGLMRDVVAWNPLAHLAYRRLKADRELEADRRAAVLTGKPLAVASSLLTMCELVGRDRGRTALRPALRFGARGRRLRRRVSNLMALAHGGPPVAPASRLSYLFAAAFAAVVALQVGVRMTSQDGALAFVWGAPDSAVARVWTPEANPWDIKVRTRAAAAATPPRRSTPGRFDQPLPPRGAVLAALAAAPAVSERNLGRWMQAVTLVARRRGVAPSRLPLQEGRGWRVQPLFDEPTIGSLGVYRMERLTLPARVPER
jgi:Zn-dependent protease with chaperone function